MRPLPHRRLFELCPVALVVECAGGRAVEPADGDDVLSRPVESCDERGGLICGNAEEVDGTGGESVEDTEEEGHGVCSENDGRRSTSSSSVK